MRAIAIQETFGLESLRPLELPDPQPGPAQVLVRVRAVSLNYRDLMTVKGLYNPRQPLPLVPLSDGAGEVVAVGAGATSVKAGDRVIGTFFQDWTEGPFRSQVMASAQGGPLPGMLSERVLLSERGLVRTPDHLSDEEAATLPCAALTAWNALVTQGRVRAGDTVLVQGTGGVSLFALQFAKMSGARVIAISSSGEKLERAKALGASDGINYREELDWDRRAQELTGGLGVDHVVEVGGADTLPRSLNAVRAAGRISVIGALSGPTQEINIRPILAKSVSVQGIFVGSRAMFEAMNQAISLHALRPVVDRIFPFAEAREALHYMESGSHFGKIVIRIDD